MFRSMVRILLAAALTSFGARASAEDLIDIYNAAVVNDPVIQSQELTLKAEQEAPAQARANLLPNVRLFGARTRNDEEVSGTGGIGFEGSASFDSNEYGFNVTQPVYDRDAFLAYDQAKLQSQLAETEFRIAEQELILRVVARYLGVLAAQDNLDLSIAERRAINRQLELAQSRLDVGLGTSTDLFDAQARFELAQAQEIEAQQVLEDAHQALIELIGRRAEQLEVLKEDSPLTPPQPNDESVWAERAKDNNLVLITAGLNEEIARKAVSRAESGRLPTLDLSLRHNVVDNDGSIGGGAVKQDATEARLQLEIPIYQGGGISADKRATRFRYEAARQNTNFELRSATRRTRSAFQDVTTAARQAVALDQAVIASEKALEAREEGFEAGLNTNLDVLDAQRDLFQAKRDYLRARYQYITNTLRLYSVAGELDVDDLETVNTWLE